MNGVIPETPLLMVMLLKVIRLGDSVSESDPADVDKLLVASLKLVVAIALENFISWDCRFQLPTVLSG